MTMKHILVLIGSPKPGRSTSLSLAEALTAPMVEAGAQVDVMTAHKAIRTPSLSQKYFDALERADLIVISFPVYVDSIPASLTEAMEMTVAHRRHMTVPRQTPLVCITNCGFPEAAHTELALAMCEQFALEAGFTWVGGVGLGGGGVIHGQTLENIRSGPSYAVVAALSEIGQSLLAGDPISDAQVAAVAQPMMSRRMYILAGTIGWMWQASSHGVRRDMWQQPYNKPLS